MNRATTLRSTRSPRGGSTAPVRTSIAAVRVVAVVVGPSLVLLLMLGCALGATLAHWRPRGDGALGRATRRLTAVGAATAVGYVALLRPWLLHWGATAEERQRVLPGDERLSAVGAQSTRAVTITAPPAQVWPWLVQFGAGRAGFYSYDWLENLAGLNIHSADHILAAEQRLRPGDVIPAARPQAGVPPTGWVVQAIEPERALVTQVGSAAGVEPATWSFVLAPTATGATRLLTRWRVGRRPWALPLLYVLLVELPHFIMERKMLLGIKERAERAERAGD